MFRYQLFTVLKSVKAKCIEIYSGGSREGPEGAAPSMFIPNWSWVPKAEKKKTFGGFVFLTKIFSHEV